MAAETPILGEGIYSLPEASRIIRRSRGLSPRQVRRWLKRSATFGANLAQSGDVYLSFSDLISLEVVTRLREQGMTRQRIVMVEQELQKRFPELIAPFAAVGIFYTDGTNIWAALDPLAEDVVQIVGTRPRHKDHMVLLAMIQPFIHEVRVAPDGVTATSWDVTKWVTVDPAIQFGRPVVIGTRVPVSTVVANLEVGTPAEVADWYGLTIEQVEGAKAYAEAA